MLKTKPNRPRQKTSAQRATSNESSLEEEARLNNEVCRRIRREAERFPTQWSPGQYIALLEGQVVAHSFDADEVFSALDQLEPDHRRGLVFQIGVDYDHIQEL